ncbi:MAG TPA: hypothetical protein PKL57_07415 [Candidatus Wallbacteria bacterium]|nr:hypothetical protein [Candidatus Wallbacteria bacterium]
MPDIFIANIDEAFYKDDIALLPAELVKKVKTLFSRFLFCMDKDDLIIVSSAIPREFIDYYFKLNGFGGGVGRIIEMPDEEGLGQLVKLILRDEKNMAFLKTLSLRGGYKIEPFIETPFTVELSEKTGLPIKRTAPENILKGVITKLNDKAFFKKAAARLAIPVVPGYVAFDREEMSVLAAKAAGECGGRIMLKNPYHAGGIGNYSGVYPEIMRTLPPLFDGGEIIEIIIEHFLDFEAILGSLVKISDEGYEFCGIDEQMSIGGRWCGFRYPYSSNEDIAAEIKKMSVLFAREAHKMGARGELNIDWGVTNNSAGGGGWKLYALESNFRHNGFGIIYNYAARYFGTAAKFIIYNENVPVSPESGSLERVIRRLEPLLIDRPGLTEGVFLVSPPNGQRCALAAAADTAGRAREIYENIERRLK